MKTLYTQISSNNQVVIPSELREEMDLTIGTKVSKATRSSCGRSRREFIHKVRGSTKGSGRDREEIHRDDRER